jgi:uncharacterized membrane protein (TIGR02234 family)
MIARARLIAVVATVLAGAVGVIASTQPWLTVVLDDGAEHTIAVAGADAIPVLAPLSLAALALGAALSVAGLVLRYVFGALAIAIGGVLAFLTGQVAVSRPLSAVASSVTDATGLTGDRAVEDLVLSIHGSVWPVVAFIASVVLLAAGAFALVTARRWRGSGRRYAADSSATRSAAPAGGSRPHDAIDSWDDLSRGDDPTAR